MNTENRVSQLAEQAKNFILIAVSLYIAYQLLNYLRPVITPFVIALLITYILRPVYLAFRSWRFPRSVSLLLTYLIFFVFFGVFFGVFIPLLIAQFKEFLQYLPKIQLGIIDLYSDYRVFLERSTYGAQIDQFITNNIGNLSTIFSTLTRSISTLGFSVINFIFEVVLGLVISVFLLKDWSLISKNIKMIISAVWGQKAVEFLKESNRRVAMFIRGQLTVAAITGVATGLTLSILGVPLAGFLGILVAIFDLVPYFGPIVAGTAGILLALSISPALAIWTLVVFVVMQQLEGLLLVPMIIGRNAQIHPLTVLLALLLGGTLFNILGIILAVPAAGIIKYWIEINLLQSGGQLEEQRNQE